MSLLGYNILLDQEAFNKAAVDLEQLSNDLAALRSKIEGMLETLRVGFDTPAGREFHRSCETNLLAPLNDQKLVLSQVSTVLRDSKTKYESVFNAYQELNNSIQF